MLKNNPNKVQTPRKRPHFVLCSLVMTDISCKGFAPLIITPRNKKPHIELSRRSVLPSRISLESEALSR